MTWKLLVFLLALVVLPIKTLLTWGRPLWLLRTDLLNVHWEKFLGALTCGTILFGYFRSFDSWRPMIGQDRIYRSFWPCYIWNRYNRMSGPTPMFILWLQLSATCHYLTWFNPWYHDTTLLEKHFNFKFSMSIPWFLDKTDLNSNHCCLQFFSWC